MYQHRPSANSQPKQPSGPFAVFIKYRLRQTAAARVKAKSRNQSSKWRNAPNGGLFSSRADASSSSALVVISGSLIAYISLSAASRRPAWPIAEAAANLRAGRARIGDKWRGGLFSASSATHGESGERGVAGRPNLIIAAAAALINRRGNNLWRGDNYWWAVAPEARVAIVNAKWRQHSSKAHPRLGSGGSA